MILSFSCRHLVHIKLRVYPAEPVRLSLYFKIDGKDLISPLLSLHFVPGREKGQKKGQTDVSDERHEGS